MKKLDLAKVRPLIQMAIEEDLGQGDVTSELLFKDDTTAKATIISREEIVVCGMAIAGEILKSYDERLDLDVRIGDGESATSEVNSAQSKGLYALCSAPNGLC